MIRPETRAAWEALQRRYMQLQLRYEQERGWTPEQFMLYFHYGLAPEKENEHENRPPSSLEKTE